MKKIVLPLIFVCFVFIIGCDTNSGEGATQVELQKGSKGLTIDFLKQGVSDQIREGETVLVPFEIRNEGFYDIRQGILIPAVERDIVEIESWDYSVNMQVQSDQTLLYDLKGKSLANTKGEMQVASLILKAKSIDDTRNKVESRIVFNTCYPYATVFSDTLCIDTDPHGVSIAEKTCKARDLSSSGQGAPVAVTKVEQKILPGKTKESIGIEFTIHAENKGKGIVTNHERYREICLGRSAEKEDFNALSLERLQFSGHEYIRGRDSDMECAPNPVRETKKGFVIRCATKDENAISKSRLTFETPIVIELSYGYKEAVSSEIQILNDNEELS